MEFSIFHILVTLLESMALGIRWSSLETLKRKKSQTTDALEGRYKKSGGVELNAGNTELRVVA